MQLHTATVDGKQIAFHDETEFFVEVGKGSGSYKIRRYRYVGFDGLKQACATYRAINIGNGYKKRLVMPSSKNPVIARYISY